MATPKTVSQSLKSIAGATLLVLGALILFVNLDAATAGLNAATGNSVPEAPGVLPAIGLAAMHLVQLYVFDHAGFLSGLYRILVSFWPLMLIIAGTALLQDPFGGQSAVYGTGAGSSAKREPL